ncbi:MAG: hypothetical protein ACLUI3_17720 [Christensenellales bacterium]
MNGCDAGEVHFPLCLRAVDAKPARLWFPQWRTAPSARALPDAEPERNTTLYQSRVRARANGLWASMRRGFSVLYHKTLNGTIAVAGLLVEALKNSDHSTTSTYIGCGGRTRNKRVFGALHRII